MVKKEVLGSVRYRFINPPPHEIQKIIKFQYQMKYFNFKNVSISIAILLFLYVFIGYFSH